MTKRSFAGRRKASVICLLLLSLDGVRLCMGEPPPAAAAAFESYSKAVESRLVLQHRSPNSFLALDPQRAEQQGAEQRLRQGEPLIDRVTEPATSSTGVGFAGALLHHWRGTAFAHGAKAADLERLLRDFNSYPRYFSPQVVQAKVLSQSGDRMQVSMRVRQRHVITVVMDSAYDVNFGQLDMRHRYSISHSTRISEIESPGTSGERVLSASEEHGFLWRQNTYWSYEERDGGLYLQIESVSLTRSIPAGLGWAIRPYVESIPRESLEFTLRSACNALRK